jgi:hypothetical protein
VPQCKGTVHILSDVGPPAAEERRREVERILKLSPGELALEKCARRQQARDAQILHALNQSLHASGFDSLDRPAVIRQTMGTKE